MISASISSHKIDKTLIVTKGDKRYLNFVLFENDKPDDYGNNGIIKQSLTKEQRAAGTKAPIVGNWKWMDKPKADAAPKSAAVSPKAGEPEADDDVPF